MIICLTTGPKSLQDEEEADSDLGKPAQFSTEILDRADFLGNALTGGCQHKTHPPKALKTCHNLLCYTSCTIHQGTAAAVGM